MIRFLIAISLTLSTIELTWAADATSLATAHSAASYKIPKKHRHHLLY